ncbi:MAG: hypothetical protein JOY85_04420 [Acidobacteriaceae bacterium]|nr:hypothetical protein [Acidobacteriaceae bacterium]
MRQALTGEAESGQIGPLGKMPAKQIREQTNVAACGRVLAKLAGCPLLINSPKHNANNC